jgi:hypothetical protein
MYAIIQDSDHAIPMFVHVHERQFHVKVIVEVSKARISSTSHSHVP